MAFFIGSNVLYTDTLMKPGFLYTLDKANYTDGNTYESMMTL